MITFKGFYFIEPIQLQVYRIYTIAYKTPLYLSSNHTVKFNELKIYISSMEIRTQLSQIETEGCNF